MFIGLNKALRSALVPEGLAIAVFSLIRFSAAFVVGFGRLAFAAVSSFCFPWASYSDHSSKITMF